MLLQTHLYYHCATLKELCEESDLHTLLRGVKNIHNLCVAWNSFFAPSMLSSAIDCISVDQRSAWYSVMNTADCISLLVARCCEILSIRQHGKISYVRRRLRELFYDLDAIILPHFRELKYNMPLSGAVFCFNSTSRFLISFIPLVASVTPSGVPGAFTVEERIVAQAYWKLLHKAPSAAEVSGVKDPTSVPFIWIPMTELQGSYECTALEQNMITGASNIDAIYFEILQRWVQEVSEVSSESEDER